MPTIYAQCGHRIVYSTAKPAKCPTCNGDIEIKVAPPAESAARRAVKDKPLKKRPRWEEEEDEDELDDEESYGFEVKITRDPNEGRLMTIEQLRNSGSPVERSESRAAALPNMQGTSAAQLVQEMLKNRGNRA